MAPSTLGTFLRAFTFGHVRQLDRVLGEALARAWGAGAGPGPHRLVIDVDSFLGEVCGRLKQGAAYGYTKVRAFEHNAVWLQLVLTAHDLIAWTQALLLTGELARSEPKRLRYRLLHVAARLAFHARGARLRLQATWPWASDLARAFARLKALPGPAG